MCVFGGITYQIKPFTLRLHNDEGESLAKGYYALYIVMILLLSASLCYNYYMYSILLC